MIGTVKINGIEHYPAEYCLFLISKYIFETKGVKIVPTVDFNNPKEVELFEKASNIVLHIYG